VCFLKEHKASILGDETDLVVAYIFEEDAWKDEFFTFLKKERVSSMVDCFYSKEEIRKSAWFTIRPKYRWEYPQPEVSSGYKNTTYCSSNFCIGCGCGLRQKEEFIVKKIPKWGKRNFLMLNWIEDELFVSEKVVETFKENGIKGYQIYDVLNSKNNKPIENIKQVYVKESLEPALVNLQQSVKEVIKCNKCGSIKYIGSGKGLTFKNDVFEKLDTDIIKSAEKFGDGHMCARLIIISKKAHDLLVSNSLDKDVKLEPIFLN
jgi:hypothetical protein